MKIEKFDYNDIEELLANTYIISDKDNNAVVIDPSKDYDGVINYLEKQGLTLKAVLLTHGHFDHMRGANRLINKYHIPLYIHYEDEENLKDSYLNCSVMCGEDIRVDATPVLVKDNDELNLLSKETIKVIHTPFHTKGSVCYYLKDNNWLITGDTLFKLSVGRDDLPGSVPSKQEESLSKIKKLPKETKIFPGHGPNSVLETELMLNHFLIK